MNRPDARFEALFRTHHPAVAAYVRRRAPTEMVDDIVNETFTVAWRRFDRIPAEPLPWLLTVARNTMSSRVRGERRRQALRARLAREPQAPHHEAPQLADSEITRALGELSAKDREAITLIAWDDLSPTEAAEVLGEAPGTFRVRLHRARGRLRAAIENQPTEVTDA